MSVHYTIIARLKHFYEQLTEIAGFPPKFSPPEYPLKIAKGGLNGFNQQAASPKYTHAFEPLVASIEVLRPDFKVFGGSNDIVAKADALIVLFNVFQNQYFTRRRFAIEWKDGVLFLSKQSRIRPTGANPRYGEGFIQNTCIYDASVDSILRHPRKTAHYRVVSYTLGGLRCVVQSMVHGYFCQCHVPMSQASPSRTDDAENQKPRRQRLLQPQLATFPCSLPRHKPQVRIYSPTLKIYPETGRHQPAQHELSSDDNKADRIPDDCLVFIKTAGANPQKMFDPEAPIYFTRRTPTYTTEYDPSGNSRTVLFEAHGTDSSRFVEDVDLTAWEAEPRTQAVLRKIVGLLKALRQLGLDGKLDAVNGEMADPGTERKLGNDDKNEDRDGTGIKKSIARKGLTIICDGDGRGLDGEVKIGLYQVTAEFGISK